MNKPKYSILIPTYNRGGLIKQTLDSAFAQDYSNFEVIVVDNCSTDNTWAVLQEYRKGKPELKLYQNATNVGPVLNWKTCLDHASGEYGKFLYSDDLISPNFVSATMALFDEKTAFVLGAIVVFKKTILNIKPQKFPEMLQSADYLRDAILYQRYRFPVSPSAASFRLNDLRNNLMIDIPNPLHLDYKSYGAGNDLLLFFLATVGRNCIQSSGAAVAYFRHHGGSLSVVNKLGPYYHYATEYFIKTHAPEHIDKWDTRSSFKQMLRKLSFADGITKYKFKAPFFTVTIIFCRLLRRFS